MRELKRVPDLRFPGFFQDWERKVISEVANKITDGTHDTPKTVSKGVPYLTAIHVKDGFVDYENCYYLEQKEHDKIYKRCNPEYGDLLMVNIGAGTANCARVNVDYEFSLKNVALIKPNKEIIDSFFFSQIQRRNSKRLHHQISSGGAQPFLALKQIAKLKLTIPQNIEEQQKIATFLSSVDKKIDQLQQKKSLLEQYKKGVMQQLFSQQLRFKDDNGNDYPDWEEKKLGQIASKVSSSISANTIEENVGEYKIYGASGYLKSIDFYREEEPYISIVKDGAGVGRTLLCEAKSSVLGTLDIIKPKNNVNLYFIYSLLNNINFTKYITGSTIPHIYFKDYSKEKIKIPTIEEQTKIANFLSAIDTKIESVNTQIENTQQFKKGLLQQMFI